MKKTVRIRKANPGETPGYINKTKKFLQKAEMGMSINQDPKRMQQMYNSAYMQLMNETPADIVYYKLISDYAVDAQTANMVLMSAFQQLVNEGYISPEAMRNQQGQEENNQSQDQTTQQPSQEEMIDQQEEEQLAMSEMEDDDSHIYDYAAEDDFDEQQMQEQAFKYGGYFNEGGYTDQDPILDQYDRAGQMNEPNFSLDDLIQQQAGVQLFNPQSSQIGDYIGNYQSMGDSWNAQNWVAKKGGSVPELPKANGGLEILKGGNQLWNSIRKPFTQGYDWYNKIAPMQNVSGLGKAFPLSTAVGYGLHKTPGLNWMLGMKAGPQQLTSTTQNIYELSKVLQGEEPKLGVFSKLISDPSKLQVDRLMLATEDLQNIAALKNKGRSSFPLSEISSGEGTIGGIYGKDSKITLATDAEGNDFFSISTKFSPGKKTEYFSVPSDAKVTSFENRIYFKPKPDGKGGHDFFDANGNPLQVGTDNLYQVTRPIVPSMFNTLYSTIFNDPSSTLGTKGFMGLGKRGPGFTDQSFLKNLVSRKEITSNPPTPYNKLGARGQIGRGLEQLAYQYGTFPFGLVPSMLGYNPIRTMGKNITEIPIPSMGYANPAMPGLTTPLQEVNRAEDVMNNTNWYLRKGRNALLGLGLTGGLGYGKLIVRGKVRPAEQVF